MIIVVSRPRHRRGASAAYSHVQSKLRSHGPCNNGESASTGLTSSMMRERFVLHSFPRPRLLRECCGTDFPFRGCLENIEGLNAYGFGPDDLRAIERENALRILPQLRR
jgi:hypothetical protein